MKTQRPRDNSQSRPTSDPNGRTTGLNEADSNQSVDGDGQKFTPSLPKRKPEQNVSQQTQAAVGLQTRPVSSAPATAASTDAGTGIGVAQRVWGAVVTYENAIYLAIFLLALFTRVYDVGTKALHHDESLHAVYGRNLYSGTGYRHDPMMHGPLQFHFIALMYWLFGASDATSRFASIACGLIVVMSPFFLRKQMGRLPALVCAFLLLVSPSVLYFSRMAREDAIFSGMEMIFMVGLWRFISMRKASDFYIMCAGVALMFTIKETAYLTGAVLGVFFLFLFAYQAGYAILGALFGYLAVLGAVELYLHNLIAAHVMPALPNIPNTDPDYDTIVTFATSFLTHPQVWSAIVLTLVFMAVVSVLFYTQKRKVTQTTAAVKTRSLPSRKAHAVHETNGDKATAAAELSSNGHETPPAATTVAAETPPDGVATTTVSTNGAEKESTEVTPLWNPRALTPKRGTFLAHYEPGSLPYVVGALLSRPKVLLTGLLIAATIFITLYTVFFSDVPRGIASGLFASLGYWIAQQEVARGGQPWFYYILIVPLYEPIAVFFSLAATVFFGMRGVRWALKRRRQSWENEEPGLGAFNTDRRVPFAKFNAFLPLFLIAWICGALILYSWAGEKMPWLMEHLSRPTIFLASLFIGALITSLISRRRQRLVEAGLLDMSPAMMGMQPRQRMAAGAHFQTMDDGRWTMEDKKRSSSSIVYRLSSAIGLAPRKLASANAQPSNSAQFSMGRGGSSQAAAMRKPAGRAVPTRSVYSVQEPPWVTWNRPDSLFPFASYLILFVLLALGWGLSISQKMYDVAFRAGTYSPGDKDVAFGWTWFFPAMMLIVTVSYAIWLGPGRAFRYLAVGIFSVMLLYELRSGFNLAYRQPDGAQEMAVYVQSSPDVTRVMRELQDFSYATTGAKNVKVVYDSEVSWPFEWYLGDYPNKQFVGGSPPDSGTDAPVMFLGYNRLNDAKLLENYVQQRYALRWWFPEEWYKNEFLPNQFAKDENGAIITDPATGKQKEASPLAQVGGIVQTIANTIAQPENETKLWNYLMYRELPKPLGSTDFVVFLRKDVAQQWHYLQYNPLPSTDVPVVREWKAVPSIDAP